MKYQVNDFDHFMTMVYKYINLLHDQNLKLIIINIEVVGRRTQRKTIKAWLHALDKFYLDQFLKVSMDNPVENQNKKDANNCFFYININVLIAAAIHLADWVIPCLL